MRKTYVFFILTMISLFAVNFVEAHPIDSTLRNAWTCYDDAEKDLATAISRLGQLDSIQGDLEVKYDVNNEEIRDGTLSALSAAGDGSIGGILSTALNLGVDINERTSLSDALGTAIQETIIQYLICQAKKILRNVAHKNLCDLIDHHNSGHGISDTPIRKPKKAEWTITYKHYEFPCGGGCGMIMHSPISYHLVTCGTAENVEKEAEENLILIRDDWSRMLEVQRILQNRTADEGCGREYYSCNQKEVEEHKRRTCNKWIWGRQFADGAIRDMRIVRCGDSYRRCMGHQRGHRYSGWSTGHKDDAHDANKAIGSYDQDPNNCDLCTDGCSACPSAGLSPANGSYSSSPGETHTANLITDGPYSQVYWYVKAPWETTDLGTNVEIVSGDGTATKTSLNYTFPSGAMHTGDFKITAYIYPTSGSVYEYSYTVHVSLD